MKKSLIICRGKSVTRLASLLELENNFNTCFLVNEWSSELNKFTKLRSFLTSQNKKIHIVNRDTKSLFSKEDYNDISFDHVLLNVREPEYNKSNIKRYLDNIGQDSKFLSEAMVPVSKTGAGGFPSTGILSVVHAAVVDNADKIYVIGLDFFEDDYFSHHSHSMKPAVFDYQKKKGLIMKEYLTEFIKKFPNKEFIFYTNSSFDPKLKNTTCYFKNK